MVSLPNLNWRPHSFSFKQGKKRSHMVRDQVNKEGMARWWPVFVPVTSTEGCTRALSYSNSQLFRAPNLRMLTMNWTAWAAKGLLLMIFVYSHSFWDEFHMNTSRWVIKQIKHYLAFWTVLLHYLLSWRFPGGQLFIYMWIVQKTPCFISCYDPIEKRLIFLSTVLSGHCKCSCDHHVGLVWGHIEHCALCIMRHVEIIRQNSVASTMTNPSTIWEWLAHTNIAVSWIVRSVLAILSQPLYSESSKFTLSVWNWCAP
jgi:hypothetical protein